MQLQPIAYVTNMARSIEWYSVLLGVDPAMTSDHWTPFTVGGSTLALHSADEALPKGNVGLSLVVDAPLEQVIARVSPGAEITDQPFGRSFVAIDPDGTHIQVNEHNF